MAKAVKVFVEIKNDVIIGIHSDKINTSTLPSGHIIQEENIEDPDSILGLNLSYITRPVKDRPKQNIIPEVDLKRKELKKISIELDLAERMGEDTTDLEDQFLILKNEYSALKSK